MVYCGEGRFARPPRCEGRKQAISFPPDLYETLEEIAKQKKVSLAWVVRDAAEKYVSDQRTASRKHLRRASQT
jgi:metal-responsive CopG/Arc/MetJ family transcriptional regulator